MHPLLVGSIIGRSTSNSAGQMHDLRCTAMNSAEQDDSVSLSHARVEMDIASLEHFGLEGFVISLDDATLCSLAHLKIHPCKTSQENILASHHYGLCSLRSGGTTCRTSKVRTDITTAQQVDKARSQLRARPLKGSLGSDFGDRVPHS